MINKALAAIAFAATTVSAHAGVLLSEGFDDVAALASNGWVFSNASTPGGTLPNWFQGHPEWSGVEAQAGAPGSYAAASYNGAPMGGRVDSWLLTPVFDAAAGATVSFYLRAVDDGTNQVNFGFVGADGTFFGPPTTVNAVPVGAWTAYTVSVGADMLRAVRFAFEYVGAADNLSYVGLDSLAVTSADVPEPASLALLAGGLLGLGVLRRRSRR